MKCVRCVPKFTHTASFIGFALHCVELCVVSCKNRKWFIAVTTHPQSWIPCLHRLCVLLLGAAAMDTEPFPDENTMIYWTGFHGDAEEDLGERCDQRFLMFFQGEYWNRPNPFFLGPKKKNGDYIGVKVIKDRYLRPYMRDSLHQRCGCNQQSTRYASTMSWQRHGCEPNTLVGQLVRF